MSRGVHWQQVRVKSEGEPRPLGWDVECHCTGRLPFNTFLRTPRVLGLTGGSRGFPGWPPEAWLLRRQHLLCPQATRLSQMGWPGNPRGVDRELLSNQEARGLRVGPSWQHWNGPALTFSRGPSQTVTASWMCGGWRLPPASSGLQPMT